MGIDGDDGDIAWRGNTMKRRDRVLGQQGVAGVLA
jgi:hypothetical protein